MHCLVIEHGMTSLSFHTALQKNEAELSSFVQFENEMASYRAHKAWFPSHDKCHDHDTKTKRL